MKTLIVLVSLFGSLALAESKTFGEGFESAKTISMTEVLAAADMYQNQNVVVAAQVDKVCKSKGCWFEVKNTKGPSTKVLFKDYSFFVPKDIEGKTITMSGRLKRKKMSVKEQRHYLKDAGASKDEIKAVTEAIQVYQFIATGVKI